MTTLSPKAVEAAIQHLANTARDDDDWPATPNPYRKEQS